MIADPEQKIGRLRQLFVGLLRRDVPTLDKRQFDSVEHQKGGFDPNFFCEFSANSWLRRRTRRISDSPSW